MAGQNDNCMQAVVICLKLKYENGIKATCDGVEIRLAGAEESFIAYTYKKHDISISYMMNDYVDFIRCGQIVSFIGIKIGMSFNEIKEIMPDAEIVKRSPDAEPDIVYYRIEFVKDDILVRLTIDNEDSPAKSMAVYRN